MHQATALASPQVSDPKTGIDHAVTERVSALAQDGQEHGVGAVQMRPELDIGTAAEVVPALCNGNISGFVFLPAPSNVVSLVLTVTVTGGTGIGVGGLGLGGSFAKGPDGLSGPGDLGTPVIGPRQVIRDATYCFPVTAPAHGKHKVTFLTDPAKATLNVQVP